MTMTVPNTTSPQIVNLGTCWGTPNGQDISMPSYMSQGFQCLGEAIARRWGTPRGKCPTDPNYGTNASDMINDDLGPKDLSYWQQQLAAEACKDERCLRCNVTVTLTAGAAMIAGVVTTAAGPFRLVVAVSSVSTTLILAQA